MTKLDQILTCESSGLPTEIKALVKSLYRKLSSVDGGKTHSVKVLFDEILETATSGDDITRDSNATELLPRAIWRAANKTAMAIYNLVSGDIKSASLMVANAKSFMIEKLAFEEANKK